MNEVLEGLLETETTHPIPLAYIPTGSGNDFARSLKLPLTFKDSIHNILKTKEPTLLDVITETANQKTIVAVNSIGFGLDGMVMNKLGKNKNKQIIGKSSYLLSILSAYFSQKAFPLKLKTPDQTYVYGQTLLVVCTNNKFFGGGISIHPEADPSDGFIDLIIAEKVTIWELFTILFSLFTTKKHLEHKKLHSHRITACDLVIYTPQYGQYDGELIDKDVHKLSFKLTTHPFWI
ncbi:hypothetical protein AKA01nite_11090 [Alkalibacterium kapii]|uniref:DAGKc domain-containing protein n=1 Tax=Alkalibacterium kapii TaxID=426704 RepID=A0A511B0Z9_9LACT|nr:hypothetical protein AKA01nite_11090 [Alkalibacterium kapii]